MKYQITLADEIKDVIKFIPEGVVIGQDERVHGIEDYLFTPQEVKQQVEDEDQEEHLVTHSKLVKAACFTITMNGLSLIMSPQIDKEIDKYIKNWIKTRDKDENEKKIDTNVYDYQIKEKLFRVGYHNGWTFVNNSGTTQEYALKLIHKAKAEETKELKKEYEKFLDYDIYEYDNLITVDNIINEDDDCEFSSVLIFQLEYLVEADLGKLSNNVQQLRIVIGWLPAAVVEHIKLRKNQFQIDRPFILGPGKSITGDNIP